MILSPNCPQCGDTLVYIVKVKQIYVIDNIKDGVVNLRYLQQEWPTHTDQPPRIMCRRCFIYWHEKPESINKLERQIKEKKDEDGVLQPGEG
jgi:hypothetical protein